MRKFILVLAILLMGCSPILQSAQSLATQQADVIWRGDAETGDLSQWCVKNEAVPGRITVVTSPVSQGQYAYRFQLNDGDTASGERVTLSQRGCGRLEMEGQEKYFGWSVYLPADYPTNTDWSLVTQFKGIHTGSPPISLNLRNDKWMLNYRPTTSSSVLHKWDAPATKGRWESFVLHVKWSANPSVGFIEFWFNGQLVVPKFYTPTMHISGGNVISNFVAMGLYRDSSISTNVVLYHDGMVAGNTYASVTGNLPPITSVPPTNTAIVTLSPSTSTITRTPVPPTPTRTPTRTPTVTASPSQTSTITVTASPTATNTVPPPGSLTCVFVTWTRGLNLRPTASMDNAPYPYLYFGYGANFPVQRVFIDEKQNQWMQINEHLYATMYLAPIPPATIGKIYAIEADCP